MGKLEVPIWHLKFRIRRTQAPEQYEPVFIKKLDNLHDRFLIIDHEEMYHLGASLKDLGKKIFAFSKMNSDTHKILAKLV